MRILITSHSHECYNKTGRIISSDSNGNIKVQIDNSEEVVKVSAGQYKITKIQD